nr:DoxX family protein [uncultured Sphingomonas sp.]
MIDFGLLIARLLLGVPFIIWGIMKLRGGDAKLVPVLVRFHLPDAKFLAMMIGVCELTGGAMVAIGYPVRLAAILLGLWCIVTGVSSLNDATNARLSHATMAGGFFALACAGAGSLALFGGHPEGVFALLG